MAVLDLVHWLLGRSIFRWLGFLVLWWLGLFVFWWWLLGLLVFRWLWLSIFGWFWLSVFWWFGLLVSRRFWWWSIIWLFWRPIIWLFLWWWFAISSWFGFTIRRFLSLIALLVLWWAISLAGFLRRSIVGFGWVIDWFLGSWCWIFWWFWFVIFWWGLFRLLGLLVVFWWLRRPFVIRFGLGLIDSLFHRWLVYSFGLLIGIGPLGGWRWGLVSRWLFGHIILGRLVIGLLLLLRLFGGIIRWLLGCIRWLLGWRRGLGCRFRWIIFWFRWWWWGFLVNWLFGFLIIHLWRIISGWLGGMHYMNWGLAI